MRAIQHGEILVTTLVTVATQFLERPGYAPSTLRSYELTLLPLLQAYGRTPVEILTRPVLEEYLNSLTHLTYTTHRRHQSILQSLLNFAVDQGHLKVNPIVSLKQRQPDRAQGEYGSDELVRYLSSEQLRILYDAVKTDFRMNALVHLLHRTGARISELLALDLAAVDLSTRKFWVVGKGNKRRWCFYSPDAAQVLMKYLKYYRHNSCLALFTAQQPKSGEVSRWSYPSVYKCWQQLIAPHSELEGVRIHDLRHTFATERVGLMGIEELRALMGHQNIQTTLRYQKVTSSRAEVVAHKALEVLV